MKLGIVKNNYMRTYILIVYVLLTFIINGMQKFSILKHITQQVFKEKFCFNLEIPNVILNVIKSKCTLCSLTLR